MILKQVIWKFQIYNILHEIFRGFTKALRISQNTLLVLSSRNLNISQNKLYIWNIQITHFKMIHDMFVFYDFEIFSNFQKWPEFRLLCENCSRNCKIKIFSRHFKSDLEFPINSLFDPI